MLIMEISHFSLLVFPCLPSIGVLDAIKADVVKVDSAATSGGAVSLKIIAVKGLKVCLCTSILGLSFARASTACSANL